MSEVHIYLIHFCDSAAHASSFLIFLFPLFAFPSAGAVDKIVFPEGMQKVDFDSCEGLTGTAENQGRVKVIFI